MKSFKQLTEAIENSGVVDKVCLLGVRGFFQSMGAKQDENDRGIYDDVVFVIGPETCKTFRFNTDPGAYKEGIATLLPGVYEYTKGMHGISGDNPYPALRQAGNVQVLRDGNGVIMEDSPKSRFWINIHKGGFTKTGSLGCQTVHPEEWDEFLKLVYGLMEEHKMEKIKYILIET